MKNIPYIIAEAGVNHNGSLENAIKLVDKAYESGADCIKFQAFSADELVIKKEPQYEMLSKLELSEEDFEQMMLCSKNRRLEFLATPFSVKWVEILYELGVAGFKISSGSINSLNLLEAVAKTNLPVILSTGMSNMVDVSIAVRILRNNGCGDLSLLHCVSLYPTPIDKANLFAMHVLKKEFNVSVGFSDHTTDVNIGALAVAAGASILEKHFTLDKNMEGPDHKASLSPEELGEYIKFARLSSIICGEETKMILLEEKETKKVAQSSLVAKRFIKKGEEIFKDMLAEKRPSTGISPMDIDKVIGKITIKDIGIDEALKYEYFLE